MRIANRVASGVIVSVLVMFVGFIADFSYWWDELYSVSAAQLPLDLMFDYLIFRDVHPPLYQVILNLWGSAFGYHESVTRLISVIAYVLMCLFVVKLSQLYQLKRLATLAICLHPLLLYYAVEARSYSLLVMLSTASFYYHLTGEKRRLFFYLMTSLTHYFGLILAGVLLILDLYRQLTQREFKLLMETIIVGSICLIWPLLHFYYGDLTGKTGGNFWIKNDGIFDTIASFVYAIFPYVESVYRKFGILDYSSYINSAFLVLCLLLAFKTKSPLKPLMLIVIFLVFVAIIDLFSPISTSRNFILLVPVFYLLIFNVFQNYNYITVLLVVCNLFYSYSLLKYKSTPLQNPKRAYEYLSDNDTGVVCVQDSKDINSMMPLIYNFYNESDFEITCKSKEEIYQNIKSYSGIISLHNKLDKEDLIYLQSENFEIIEVYEHRKNATILAVKK